MEITSTQYRFAYSYHVATLVELYVFNAVINIFTSMKLNDKLVTALQIRVTLKNVDRKLFKLYSENMLTRMEFLAVTCCNNN